MDKSECPHCGSPVGHGISVCRECGKEVNTPEEAPVHEQPVQSSKKNIYGIFAIFLVVVGGAALLFFTGLIPNPFKDKTAAAIVNGEKISFQELDQKLELFKKIYGQNQIDYSSPQGKMALEEMKKQILNTMIQEKILITEAAKQKIVVTPPDIAEKIAAIKKMMNLSDKDFEAFLKNHSMSVSNFEKRVEKEVLINKLLDKGVKEKGLTKDAWLQQLNSQAKVEILTK